MFFESHIEVTRLFTTYFRTDRGIRTPDFFHVKETLWPTELYLRFLIFVEQMGLEPTSFSLQTKC